MYEYNWKKIQYFWIGCVVYSLKTSEKCTQSLWRLKMKNGTENVYLSEKKHSFEFWSVSLCYVYNYTNIQTHTWKWVSPYSFDWPMREIRMLFPHLYFGISQHIFLRCQYTAYYVRISHKIISYFTVHESINQYMDNNTIHTTFHMMFKHYYHCYHHYICIYVDVALRKHTIVVRSGTEAQCATFFGQEIDREKKSWKKAENKKVLLLSISRESLSFSLFWLDHKFHSNPYIINIIINVYHIIISINSEQVYFSLSSSYVYTIYTYII